MQLVDLWKTGGLFDEKGKFFQNSPISSGGEMEET
jgi:hypothetical protein